MKHRRTYLPASEFVDQMVRRHHANRCCVWEILDAYFNIIKGLGCVLTLDERMEAEDMIVRYLNTDAE